MQESGQNFINSNFTGTAHSTKYRSLPTVTKQYTPYSTMYHTAHLIKHAEVCRKCGICHFDNCFRENTYSSKEFSSATYRQNSSLSKLRDFSIKDTINTIPVFSGCQKEVEDFITGCGRTKGMISQENEIEWRH